MFLWAATDNVWTWDIVVLFKLHRFPGDLVQPHPLSYLVGSTLRTSRSPKVSLLLAVIISFHFLSFPFISFHFHSRPFISFHFCSFHVNSCLFNSFPFLSIPFPSLPFISFPFLSFHVHSDSKAHRFYCNRTFSPSWWEAHLEHSGILGFPCCWLLSFPSISFHFLLFPFLSFPFMSICFLSCLSFHFPFMSFSFLALISLQVLSCPSCTPCYKWCSYELLP